MLMYVKASQEPQQVALFGLRDTSKTLVRNQHQEDPSMSPHTPTKHTFRLTSNILQQAIFEVQAYDQFLPNT